MLSSGDQEKACELVDTIRSRNLVRPVVLIRRDQYGTVYLVPVDRNDNKLYTDLRTVLNDAVINDENPHERRFGERTGEIDQFVSAFWNVAR